MRRNVGAIAAEIAADPAGLGGDAAGQDCEGKNEFDQSFHGVDSFVEDRSAVSAAFAASLLFVHSNSLHSLHRKRPKVSYSNSLPAERAERREASQVHAEVRGNLKMLESHETKNTPAKPVN